LIPIIERDIVCRCKVFIGAVEWEEVDRSNLQRWNWRCGSGWSLYSVDKRGRITAVAVIVVQWDLRLYS
jgi:hypothetical protein